MKSLVKWATNRIKSATNTATTALLRFVVNKFLETPLSDKSQFSIRNDWSVQFFLKTLFLSPNQLNSFIPVLSFRSFYISAAKYDSKINLSKQRCTIDRVVVEVDFDCSGDKTPNDLITKSFQNQKDETTFDQKQTIFNWILGHVESIEIEVSKITILIQTKIELVTLEIEGLNFSIDRLSNSLFSGEIRKLIMTVGSQRPLTTVLKLFRTSFIFLNDALTIKSPKGIINLTEPLIKILAYFYKNTKNMQNNDENKSEIENNYDFSFCVNIAIVDFKTVCNFSGAGRNLEATFRIKYFDFSFESIETYHEKSYLLKAPELSFSVFIPSSSTVYNKAEDCPFSDIEKAINWQNQLYKKEMIKFISKIQQIEGNLTSKSCLDLIKLIMILRVFSGDDLMGLSVSVSVNKVNVFFENILNINLSNPNFSLYLDTMKSYPIYANFSLSFFEVMMNDFIIAQNIIDTSIIFFQIFDDNQTKPKSFTNISNIIFSIPYNIELSPKTSQNPENQNKNVFSMPNIDFIINISDVFVDYVSRNQPARLINHISLFHFSYLNGTGSFDTFISTHLSNMRCPLPLDLFSSELSLFYRYGFCEIVQLNIRNGSLTLNDKEKNINIPETNLVISMCADSFEVLKGLLASLIETSNNNVEDEGNKKNNLKNNDNEFIDCQEIEQIINESLIVTEEELDSIEKIDINEIPNKNEQSPSFIFTCDELTLSFFIYGGRDLSDLFDLRTLSKQLRFTKEVIEPLEFELISLRNENECIEFVTTSSIEFSTFEPLLNKMSNETASEKTIENNEEINLIDYNKNKKLHFKLEVRLCDVIDRIKNSMAKLIFSTEFNGSMIFEFDLLQQLNIFSNEVFNNNKENHCRIMIELPKFGAFITNEQLSFFVNFFSKTRPFAHTLSSASSSSNESLVVDYFSLKGDSFCISAHFKFYLNVSLEDVEMNIHDCILLDSRSISDLVGRVAGFYLLSMQKMAVISGLPVLNNLKRIGGAVRTLFTFDVEHLGIARGLGVSFGILMKTLATETLNASSCVTSTVENLIKFTIFSISGDDDRDIGIHTAIATLIIAPKSKFEEKGFGAATGEFLIQIPRVLLAPGVVAFGSATKMIRYLKTKVNPKDRKERIYLKQ